jgi:hypothetical protein
MSFEFALYDALVSIDVPTDKARAVVDALEHDMGSTLASKQDILPLASKQDVLLLRQEILLVKQELENRIDGLGRDVKRLEEKLVTDLELLRSSMTVRLGSIQVVTTGLLFAALKLA